MCLLEHLSIQQQESEQLILDEIAFQFCFRKRSKTDDLDQRNVKGVKELFDLSVASAFFRVILLSYLCLR